MKIQNGRRVSVGVGCAEAKRVLELVRPAVGVEDYLRAGSVVTQSSLAIIKWGDDEAKGTAGEILGLFHVGSA